MVKDITSEQTKNKDEDIGRPVSAEGFREAAVVIGHRLADTAIRTRSEAMWVGPILLPDERWSLMPVGYDLYNGTAGIALFLGHLGAESQNKKFTELARAAIYGARKQLLHRNKYYVDVLPSAILLNKPGGGFTGDTSVIYAMLRLGVLWEDNALLDEALTAANNLSEAVSSDRQLDIIGGLAGCILVLISLYRQTGAKDPLDLAVKCGQLLLVKSEMRKSGRVWKTPILNGGPPLSGFSHGNAGFAYSLLKLAAIASEKKFEIAALEALDYERTLFSKKAKNWRDLRTSKLTDQNERIGKFAMAWCHGAPGIALARLLSVQYCKNRRERSVIRTEIEIALTTTIAHGFGGNHSLCHGDFGNIETLLVASKILQRPIFEKKVTEIATQMLEDIILSGYKCGTPNNIETPGLMTGLAGIGLGLLRVSSPTKIESILMLE